MARKPQGLISSAENSIAKLNEAGNGNLKMFNFRIDADLLKQVKLHCVKNDITMASFATEAIIEKLKAAEGK